MSSSVQLRPSRSIGLRLSLLMAAVVLATIVGAVSFFSVNDFRQSLLSERDRLESSAAAFAAAISPALATGDRSGAFSVLRGVSRLDHATYARATLVGGALVAELGDGVTLIGRDGDVRSMGLIEMARAQSLVVEVPVVDGGVTLGTLMLQADVGWLRAAAWNRILIIASIALLALAATIFVAGYSVRRILAPLRDLSSQMQALGSGETLSLRLVKHRNDEVGVLVDAFDSMAERIADRDRQLRQHRDSLEATVEIRTAELRQAVAEAERANAAKSEFLATMSHEIRTPMNGMMVMAEMLSASPLPSRQKRFAEIITRSGRGLLNIINDVLDFSKIESGALSLERIPFSPTEVVEDVVRLFSERAREKSLSLAVVIGCDVPLAVYGDPTRFGQVVSNLVNNALKFTETGGVLVRLDRVGGEQGRDALELSVRDSGVGIRDSDIPNIFTSFKQADQTITRRFGGTGLGLAITKRLVVAMGGDITVASELGVGSTFRFRFQPEVVQEASMPMRPAGLRVAVRSNDAIFVEAWGLMLRDRGGHVVDGSETADMDVVDCRTHDGPYPRLSADTPTLVVTNFGSVAEVGTTRRATVVEWPLSRRDADRLLVEPSFGSSELPQADPAERPKSANTRHFGLRALAVDDNAINREVLAEALASLGIRVDTAASGEEAIRVASDARYDIIFMDCSMPGMDGFEATGRIREQEGAGARARIIALTAHVDGSEASRWRGAGMDGYIAKPFAIADLEREINATIRNVDAATSDENGREDATAAPPTALVAPDTLRMFSAVSGGDALARRIFGMFEHHARTAFADLAGLGDDAGALRDKAHALKSMALSAGASKVGEICHRIETAASGLNDGQPARIALLGETIEATIAEMRRITAGYDQPTAATTASG